MNRTRANLHLVFSLAIFFSCFSVWSQKSYWKKVQPAQQFNQVADKDDSQFYELDVDAIGQRLNSSTKTTTVIIPDFSGEMIQYTLKETPVFHPELSRKYPNIKSYTGWSSDKKQKVRISFSHKGISVMALGLNTSENTFIEREKQNTNLYKVFKRKGAKEGFVCKTPMSVSSFVKTMGPFAKLVDDQTLRRYRIAVSATGEYTEEHGGTVADALAAINATLTRVNEVFETDLGITLELIANNDDIIFTNASTDPYNGSLNSQVQSVLTSTIGEDNYDVGHLFHKAANNGNAGSVGNVCIDGQKGSAFSAGEEPEGDLFDIDYVAHELGHQFGANHTWSFESEGTGMQAEPASGTTIMGYAGIVEGNNVAPNGNDYFHYNSIQQITDYVRSQSCAQEINLTNNVPVITEISDYSIPVGTAFVLTGEATDADGGDILSYTWEQIDDGVVTTSTFGPDNPVGANFRSLPPSTNPSRYFPRLSRIVAGELTQTNPGVGEAWETVANVERELNFALTVRDNASGGGQVASELVKVDVLSAAGPFLVSSQSSSESYQAGSLIDVVWDVANTNQVPISAQEVDILLSIDGGFSYPDTLATNVPNIGAAKVQLPGLSSSTSTARIMVKPSDNVFFAINAVDFEILQSDVVLNFPELEFEVCQPDDLTVNFVYETFNGFSGTTTLSADVPTGVVSNFIPSTVSVNETDVNLQLTNLTSLGVGSYPIVVNADADGTTFQVELQLHIFDTDHSDVVLTNPQDLEANTAVNPAFSWQVQANANSYDIEIATDELFSDVVETASVNSNGYVSKNLLPESTYYWRVRASNECSVGAYGTPFSFSTIGVNCETIDSRDLPQEISEAAPSTVTTTISVLQELLISEVELNMELNHTYLQDLIISLTSPSGTKVIITSNTCGNLNNINAIFDDDGDPIVCSGSPAISGTVQPLGSLATFKGESTLGDWILDIEDTASGDGGELVDFSIVFCVEGVFRPDEDNDGVFDDGDDLCLGTPKGVDVNTDGCPVYRFAQDNFNIQINSESCRSSNDGSILVTAADTMITYTANLSGIGMDGEETFTETSQFNSLPEGNYQLCITGTDGTIVYEESCFTITIEEPEELDVDAILNQQNLTASFEMEGGSIYNIELNGVVTQTRDNAFTLNLENGLNVVRVYTNLPCQGEFQETFYIDSGAAIVPNPVQTSTTIFIDDFAGLYQLAVYSYDGKLIRNERKNTTTGAIELDLTELTSGFYFVKITGNRIEETFKILKR